MLCENSQGEIHFPSTRTLAQKLRCNDMNFLDLVSRCLEWDPEKRITPEGALRHQWILEGLPANPFTCRKKFSAESTERGTTNRKRDFAQAEKKAMEFQNYEKGQIGMKKQANVSLHQNAVFIRIGKKQSNIVGMSQNNSINMEDNKREIFTKRLSQPKKIMPKIRLANNVLNIIKPKNDLSHEKPMPQRHPDTFRHMKGKNKYETNRKNTMRTIES